MNFKTLLIVCFIFNFTTNHAQEKKNKLSFLYRETWSKEYYINVEIYKSDSTEDFEVKKVVNHEIYSNFKITKNQYDSLVNEIKNIKFKPLPRGFHHVDGNSFYVNLQENDLTISYNFVLVYEELNSEAITLLNMFKSLIEVSKSEE